MSSKSAVRLVVPEGRRTTPSSLGGDPDRIERRAERRRLLPRRSPAHARRVSGRRTAAARSARVRSDRALVLTTMRGHARGPRPQAKFSQMFSNSRAVNVLAAARILLFASRDVCSSSAPGLISSPSGLELLADGRLPRDLGESATAPSRPSPPKLLRRGAVPLAASAATSRAGSLRPCSTFVLAIFRADRDRPLERAPQPVRSSSSSA